MSKWQLILVGAGMTYVLRALPLLLLRRMDILENGKFSRFLNYAASSVMGGIIYSAMYGEKYYQDLLGHFAPGELLKFFAVVLAFVIGISTHSVLKSLLFSISTYTVLRWALF